MLTGVIITEVHCAYSYDSSKKQVHNVIEKKRKDRLKIDIEDIRKLIPDSEYVAKKLVCIQLLYDALMHKNALIECAMNCSN